MDVMALVKERRAKAEGKVARAEKALESAKKELAELLAAERVVGEITGESPEPRTSEGFVSAREIAIAKLIPSDPENAIAPAELYPKYIDASGEEINLDAFRTAIWRLKGKKVQGEEYAWIVKADNGRYWRERVPEPEPEDIDDLI